VDELGFDDIEILCSKRTGKFSLGELDKRAYDSFEKDDYDTKRMCEDCNRAVN